MSWLITQSLLASWARQYDCMEGYEEEAREDFLRTLRREPGETTEAMLNGLKFEERVYRAASGKPIRADANWREGALTIAEIIRGAQIQVKASREIEVDGETYLVYGILDALKAGTIYDVKFSNKSLGSADMYGKYLESPQHPAYFYIVPEADAFKYLLSDGEDVYIETYRREDTPHISTFIRRFAEDLEREGLTELYRERWLAQ